MPFLLHGMKGRVLNTCQSCLRSRVRVNRLRNGTQYFHREFSAQPTALTTSRPQFKTIQATKLDFDKVQLVEKSERETQLELLTAERSVLDPMSEDKFCCVERTAGNINSMKVYRLLRAEEDPARGLYPKIIQGKDDNALKMSVAQHIEAGSRFNSRYISTSKRLGVCLFYYASKAIYERDTNGEELRIAEIELDLLQGNVMDLTDKHVRMEHGMKKGSKA